MYDNDYSVSLLAVAAWLLVATLVAAGIGLIRQPNLRKRLAIGWALFPAIAMTTLCAILYVVLPDERYMSPPGGHWLVMLGAAAALSIILTPVWALSVWLSLRAVDGCRNAARRRRRGT